MAGKSWWLTIAAVSIVALIAFFTGRNLEERAVAAKARASARILTPLPAAVTPAPPSHRELAVTAIVVLPFAEFYEALRSAPAEAREKWATELAAMPKGPRRMAAVSGFFKLLVQFDPNAAAKAIGEIQDVELQKLALGSAINAAPGFALPLMAELSLNLQDRLTGKRDFISDVMLEWASFDAPAVAHFIDEHTDEIDEFNRGRYFTTYQVISYWATVDPKATKEWIDRTERWGGWEVQKFFVEGWYENDRAAAVSYTLAHAEDPDMSGAIGGILCSLYFDSKEQAKKFVESLPEDKRPEAFQDAFRHMILVEGEDTGDPAFTPRAVASWMTEFPPAYWKGALGRLFGFDAKGAANMLSWIKQLPPEVREAAAAEYSAPFVDSASEEIMPVLQETDLGLRDHLFRALLKNDSLNFDEATTAINQAPLSTEQKQHFWQIIAAVKAEKAQKAAQDEAAREQRTPDASDPGGEN